MFIEDEDWNDDSGADVPSKSVVQSLKQKKNISTKVKAVGKKSLLRTLQTLGSVPDWQSDERQRDSDESEAAPAAHTKKKKNKKRRRKRKHSETTEEKPENGDLDQKVTEDGAGLKKKKTGDKVGVKKVKAGDKTKGQGTTKAPKVETNNSEAKLSRQQWKNKMKNKRKSKNKYRATPSEEEVNTAENQTARAKFDLNSNSKESPVQEGVWKKGKKDKSQKQKIVTQSEKEERPIEKKRKDPGDEQEQPPPEKKLKPELSREQSLKREKLRKLLRPQIPTECSPTEKTEEKEAAVVQEIPEDRSASLRSRMERRLDSARFRYINEVLYSTSSGEARRMFKQDPQAFWIYHRGYTAQVQRWPNNPVDAIVNDIRQRPASLVVADFGCGDCKIAQSVKNKVHCFDLVATCELVTVCDMANVPLKDGTVDIAVFCLSLMGTNLGDFLKEANRVLKMGGVLKIAEVASRFDNVRSFMTALAGLGFKMVSKDTENSHFYLFEFIKTASAPENLKKFGLQLKPCVYKKR